MKSELLMDVFCVFFLLSSQPRLSAVSVVLDFNASLNDDAPVSPKELPVIEKRKEKSELLMDDCCAFFPSLARLNQSVMSVAFNCSDSLNCVAPVSPMLLPVIVKRKGKK